MPEIAYIFWGEGKHFYVKKLDRCRTYAQVELAKDVFFRFYDSHSPRIKNEKISCFLSKSKSGIPDILDPEHTTHHKIAIRTSKQLIEKDINTFDLQKKYESKHNMNYSKNRHLSIFIWDKRLYDIIQRLEQQKAFD